MKKYFLLLLCLSVHFATFSQYIFNDGAKIVAVSGTYSKGGTWTNNTATSETSLTGAQITLAGDLVNNGNFAGNALSMLSFQGTALQNVQGSVNPVLYNMEVNNTANHVNLANSVRITNNLALTDGRLIAETAPVYFTPTAINPSETNANRIIGTAIMEQRTFGAAVFPLFLDAQMAAGADIGDVTLTRYTGATQGIITILGNQSIASYWTFETTVAGTRDLTLSWLSDLDNGKNLLQMQRWRTASYNTVALPWTAVSALGDLSARTFTQSETNLQNSWTYSDNTAPLSTPVCTWTGAISNDWNTAGNWSCGVVPTCADDVNIPAGPATMPIFNAGTANVKNITIAAGATLPALTISGGTFNVCADWTNAATTGHFVHTNGNVNFVGTAAQNISGLNSFDNLTVNNGGNGVTLNNATQVKGLLNLQDGNLTSSGNLTLISDATKTAMVVNNGAFVVVGDATVQRHITPYGVRPVGLGYTYIANPTTTGTITSAFSDDLGLVFNSAYKFNCWLYPAPYSSAPFPNIYLYNETLVATGTDAACMSENTDKFETAWQSAAAGTSFTPGSGFCLNISGNTTTDVTGTLNNGNINAAITKTDATAANSGWNLVGNPYPSPIDWDLVYNDNVALVGAQIARRIATGTYSGTFAYYVANVAGSGTNGATDEIAGMQGFLLRANMSGNLQFNNAQRLTSYSNPNFFRTQFFDLIRLQMKGSRGADETTIYFGNQGSEDFEVHTDAWKANFNSLPAPNLYTHASNKALAINGLAELTEEEIIPLSFIAAENGKQVINISHSEGFEGVNIFLEDKKLKVLHDLKGGAYSFTANQGKEESRFQLRFKPTAEREKAIEFDFLVYPNPTKDVLKVQLSKTLTSRMLITDILGRVILETNGTERETKIDVSNLPSGVYVLEVQTEAGSKSLKFVKEN